MVYKPKKRSKKEVKQELKKRLTNIPKGAIAQPVAKGIGNKSMGQRAFDTLKKIDKYAVDIIPPDTTAKDKGLEAHQERLKEDFNRTEQVSGTDYNEAEQMLEKELGRKPTDKEVFNYIDAGGYKSDKSEIGNEPQILTDEKGNVTGVILSDGRVFSDITYDEAQQLAEADIQGKMTPMGSVIREDVLSQHSTDLATQAAASQIGQYDSTYSTQGGIGGSYEQGGIINRLYGGGTPIDPNQVMAQFTSPSTWADIFKATATGAGAGAVVGGALTPGFLGAIPGAIIGGIIGLAQASFDVIDRNIKAQKTDQINAQARIAQDYYKYGRQIAAMIKVHPENAGMYIDQYNRIKYKLDESYTNLKLQTQQNSNLRLGLDGTTTLAYFNSLYMDGGGIQIIEQKIRQALGNPNAMEGMYELSMLEQEGGGSL